LGEREPGFLDGDQELVPGRLDQVPEELTEPLSGDRSCLHSRKYCAQASDRV
jgi:hypothetical protein